MQEIVNRIKNRRIELGYSFQELADLTGMSKSTLQRYEAGAIKNIPLDKLEILAAALRIQPEWILGWDEPTTIAAHHDEEDWTEEELAEIENFKKYVRSKRPEPQPTTIKNITALVARADNDLLQEIYKNLQSRLLLDGKIKKNKFEMIPLYEPINSVKELKELENEFQEWYKEIDQNL